MDNNVENNINSEFNGLTAAEVNARIEAGKINIADDSSDRTTGKICLLYTSPSPRDRG